MRKIVLIYTFMVILLALTGCSNGSASTTDGSTQNTSEITENKQEQANSEANVVTEQPEESIAEEAINPSSVEVNDYINGSTFDLDAYVTALGYETLPDPEGYNDLILDIGGTHYFVNVRRTDLNVFFCQGNYSYAMCTQDIKNAPEDLTVISGKKSFSASELWVREDSRLLKYLATTSPESVDLSTLHLKNKNSCTLYHGIIRFDSDGRIDTDSTVGLDPELLWNENYK